MTNEVIAAASRSATLGVHLAEEDTPKYRYHTPDFHSYWRREVGLI